QNTGGQSFQETGLGLCMECTWVDWSQFGSFCTSDNECCPGTYCVSALIGESDQTVSVCRGCVQTLTNLSNTEVGFCDGDTYFEDGMGHTAESTAICCDGFQCL